MDQYVILRLNSKYKDYRKEGESLKYVSYSINSPGTFFEKKDIKYVL